MVSKDFDLTPDQLRNNARHTEQFASRFDTLVQSILSNANSASGAWGSKEDGQRFANGDGGNGYLAQVEWLRGVFDGQSQTLHGFADAIKQTADALEQADQEGNSGQSSSSSSSGGTGGGTGSGSGRMPTQRSRDTPQPSQPNPPQQPQQQQPEQSDGSSSSGESPSTGGGQQGAAAQADGGPQSPGAAGPTAQPATSGVPAATSISPGSGGGSSDAGRTVAPPQQTSLSARADSFPASTNTSSSTPTVANSQPSQSPGIGSPPSGGVPPKHGQTSTSRSMASAAPAAKPTVDSGRAKPSATAAVVNTSRAGAAPAGVPRRPTVEASEKAPDRQEGETGESTPDTRSVLG